MPYKKPLFACFSTFLFDERRFEYLAHGLFNTAA